VAGRNRDEKFAVHHIGMTTACPPNKKTPGNSGYSLPGVDINSERKRFGGPIYVAITSRTYHPGGVTQLAGRDLHPLG